MGDQRYRIHNLSLIILYKIYSHHISGDESQPLSLRQVRDLFTEPLPLNLIESSIDWMRTRIDKDYLRRTGTKDAYRFSIAPEGIKYIELGSRLIKSTIQERRSDRQRPGSFEPACHNALRHGGSP